MKLFAPALYVTLGLLAIAHCVVIRQDNSANADATAKTEVSNMKTSVRTRKFSRDDYDENRDGTDDSDSDLSISDDSQSDHPWSDSDDIDRSDTDDHEGKKRKTRKLKRTARNTKEMPTTVRTRKYRFKRGGHDDLDYSNSNDTQSDNPWSDSSDDDNTGADRYRKH